MNVDCNSDTNQNRVTSKYFTKESMDDSLSDFKEVKKGHSGPKISKTNPKKPRKPAKKPKGQKDIRTALKPKQNDLISYTEKFDTVCKKAGIDVDTEELQLAIALSKSLQNETCEDSDQKEVSTQERIKKIKTTLQEYGFKVPEAKINKKRNRHRKHYQLISKSVVEKEQIIADRYSQVLLTNVDKLNNCNYLEGTGTSLFHKSTNILYKDIKNHDIFYNIELVEQSTSNGCIFRDWAKIPGRPASPQVSNKIEMNFSEIECSQEELDLVLSGLLTQTKKIISLKQSEKEKLQTKSSRTLDSDKNNELRSNNDIPSIIIEREESSEEIVTENKNINHEAIYRSCSPDIFDDEESVIEVIPANTTVQEKPSYIMDLTECVNNVALKNRTFATNNSISLSQKCNPEITRRKSNDFMEMTECVVSTSHAVHVNVDLTQIPGGEEFVATEQNEATLDLTQSSESGDDLPEVYFSGNKNFDDTVPLNGSDYEEILSKDFNPSKKDSSVLYDFTQDDTLEINQGKNVSHTNKDPETVENNNENICNNVELTLDPKRVENNANFTKSPNSSPDPNSITQSNINSVVNNEYITENIHSFNIFKCSTDNTKNQIGENNASTERKNDLPDGNIDLTQSSNHSDETVIIPVNNTYSQVKDNYTIGNSNLDIFNSTPDNCDNIQIADYEVSACVKSNKHMPESNVDLTQSSNSSTPKMDGVYEKYSSYEDSLEISNDSGETVMLPLKYDCEKVNNIQDDLNSLVKRDNISVAYDEVSFVYDANESSRGNNSSMSLTKESEDENKRNHPDLGQNAVFRIDANSNGSDKTIILPLEDTTEKPANNLGQKDNVSIDYDEVSIIHDYYNIRDISKSPHTSKSKDGNGDISQSSQNSEFRLTDNELNYSLHKSKHDNFDFGGLSVLENLPNIPSFRKSRDQGDANLNKDNLLLELKENENDVREGTPERNVENVIEKANTPENEYIIKFDDVTPMPDYTRMSSPEMIEELDKYGLKPFKRKRAIQLLTHIYNQTHPIIESMDDLPSPAKRMKLDTPPNVRRKLLPSPKKAIEILETQDIYEVTNEVPDLKEIECAVEDWVFQKREKSKVHSCRVPLHIAFHNYVSCRRGLRESILRYEPVDIDVIHKQLVAYGHRYDPKELLKFMDKKCITVKTADNKNNKY